MTRRARRRAARRLIVELMKSGPAGHPVEQEERLLVEAWLWRQAGGLGQELECRRLAAQLRNGRVRSLEAARRRHGLHPVNGGGVRGS